LESESSGSVAICGLIIGNMLYVANLGDAKAIVIQKNGNFLEMNSQHTPDRKDEYQRIEKQGGWILNVSN